MSGMIGQQGRTRPSVIQPTPTATPAGPLTGNRESATAKKIADRSGKAGLVAAAEITRAGAPSERSGSQRIASYLKKKGFGADWDKRIRDQARNLLIASETQDVGSPNYGNKDYSPNEADLKEVSYRLAMEQANRIDNPKARDLAQQLVSDTYGVEPSGKLQTGVVKSDKPRKGLLGQGAEGTREETIKELGARKRVRLAKDIAREGITDEVLKADIEKMERAKAEGDAAAYAEAERQFNQRLNANLAIDTEDGISLQDPTRQAKKRISQFSKEAQGREDRFGQKDTGDRGGSTEEGKATEDAPEISRQAFDVLAADDDLTDKFFDRFSETDKKALRAKFKKIKDDPNSEAAQMTRADLMRTFNKALSIEGMVKAQTILGELGSPAARRAAKMQEVRDAASPETRRGERREQLGNIRSAIKVIESVMSGARRYDSRTAGREAMTADIGSVMNALRQYVPGNRLFQDRMQGQVRKAFGMAASGNVRPIGEIMRGLQMLGQKAPPTIEEQVGSAKGDVPQLAAMMTGIGNRIRGGASTARAKPGARNVLTGKRLKKGVAPAAEPKGGVDTGAATGVGESAGLPLGRARGNVRQQPVRQEEGGYATGRVELNPPKVETSGGSNVPPKRYTPRGGRMSFVRAERPNVEDLGVPTTDKLSNAFDQFMADTQSEMLGKGDVRMQGRDAETMGKVRGRASERLRSLMKAYKDETKQLNEQKDIAEIRDAKQLSAAERSLADLKKEIADGKKKLDDIRRYIAPPQSKNLGEDVRRRVPVDESDDFRPTVSRPKNLPQTQGVETIRDFQAALEGRIKVLQGRVTAFEQELARATQGKGIGPRVMGAAVREGRRKDIDQLRYDKPKIMERFTKELAELNRKQGKTKRDLDKIQQLENQIKSLEERVPSRKPVAPKGRPSGTSTPALPEVVRPSITRSERDERAFTGGKMVKGVEQQRGRKQSEPVKRAMSGKRRKLKRAQKSGYVQKREDEEMVGRGGLGGLLEGLPT
jgi:hypothetical protein